MAIQQKIVTFLWFDEQAEEAAEYYTSIFKRSKVTRVTRYPESVPGMAGKVMTVNFELDGQQFIALNGGPEFKFTEAISLFVHCETQAEVDELWSKLTAGGQESQCGWLKDRYGLSWQIAPAQIMDLVGGPDPAGANRATQAMMQMKKLDLPTLQRAYAGEA